MKLPSGYLNYLKNGGETEFEADFEFGGYMALEPLERIEEYNKEIEIEEYAPGYIAFGSDGGGEAFVFDDAGIIYLMPLIGMAPDEAIKVVDSWSEYEKMKLKTT
ncbi:MAG: SMI1/KNR4 family protein [Acidimicrobiales bacterium]|nr:SMI1/KNR4 family protein [Akkermansiaceae bacterium]MDE0874240.1 SMI1/KNR4 family protein [Acidimicrobiales bacterium]